ncbi:hypothetical protein [Chengkuizengella sediminis]|uniref:hypothetical protein n=1 Tax=Chengkuizengella sediminis TaxID=1885917 RepID=UPI0013894601|nr:hypothetical protein [Chengkuizengella sediminis]NDI35640.1 hypothetical protein [Chengkuizengella sediminis]
MGHFDETICDCCVCPMQCVLEQLVGEENIRIFALNGFTEEGTLTGVDNFIALLDAGGIVNKVPIHNICAVRFEGIFDFKLKPIRKSKSGECSCIEDPITNLAKSMIGEETPIEAGSFSESNVTIKDVGEGIVIVSFLSGGVIFTAAISSCKIQNFGFFD